MKTVQGNNGNYIESKKDVIKYIDKLRYLLNSNQAKIQFQQKRQVDEDRDEKYTNRYTIGDLFPDDEPTVVLKRELGTLTVENYIETVKDIRFKNLSDMRVFGKNYNGKDVYIKIRVELLKSTSYGLGDFIFVMSFHYSTIDFKNIVFPYSKK